MRINRALGLIAICLLVQLSRAGLPQTPQPGHAPTIEFFSDRTIAEVGRTRVIPFRADRPTDEDTTLEGKVTPIGVLEIIRDPSVLAGERIGFLRVRGLAPGTATIAMGDTTLRVEVVEPRAPINDQFAPIRLIGPAPGAAIWGTVSIGVEIFEPGDAESPVVLDVGSDRWLEPTSRSDARLGPHRRIVFELDAESLPVGTITLTAILRPGQSSEVVSEPVRVHIVRPDNLISGEAEARYEVDRPERFIDERRSIGRDPAASGGAFFANAASVPAVCFPIHVDQPGRYQMIVRASGSLAGGSLPTVGFVVDGAQQPSTNGRLLREDWHRITVGVPVMLQAGDRVITPYFQNDFYVPGLSDRNLRLDTIELLRLDPDEPNAMPSLGGTRGEGMVAPSLDADSDSMADAMSGSTTSSMSGGMSAMGTMAGLASGAEPIMLDDPLGTKPVPLRVALAGVYDGLPIGGSLIVAGSCFAQGANPATDPARTPMVTLEINGKPYAHQRSLAPRFEVDPRAFVPGKNTLRLIARLDRGLVSMTPIQHMSYDWSLPDPDEKPENRSPPRVIRLSVHDTGWDRESRARIAANNSPSEHFAFDFHSQGKAVLTLPDDLVGRFEVAIEARGQNYQGPPIAQVDLLTGPDPTDSHTIGQIEIATWWDTRSAGVVDLRPGPKRLVVSFINDKYDEGKGDRNMWFQAVVLREVALDGDNDLGAPIAQLLYPPQGTSVFMADAVVATITDNRSIASVEVLIDEIETGVARSMAGRPGMVVLPLIARDLDPGEHTLRIRVVDSAGNTGFSQPVTIRVLAHQPDHPTRYERAVFLLDRFALGPDRREMAALLTMGEHAWLEDRLSRPFNDAEATALANGLIRFPNAQSSYDISRRVLDHALRTPNPVRARFVLWTQNHFSTWVRKVEGRRKWDEHGAMTRLGVAPFADLLLASATSPAMLRYLDQDRSFAGRLNENYAREIMELHTLGVDGGYDQGDVTALAALLTGWRGAIEGDGSSPGPTRSGRFRFDPALNDGRSIRAIGVAFKQAIRADRFDRVLLAIETLASHPSTARFIARSLAEHYVAVPAPDDLVDDLAAIFAATDGDMRAMLLAIADHRDFWASMASRRMAHPIDFALRLGRASRFDNPWELGAFLDRSGTGLFDRPTPDGYPQEDAAYGDSNALLQRWVLAQEAVWSLANLVPDAWRYTGAADSRRWAQRTVDLIAVGLTGRVLGDASNEAALDFLMQTTGSTGDRVLQVAPLIAQMPEASLR